MDILKENVNFLTHVGVKKMKWGIRNASSGVSRKEEVNSFGDT